MKIFFKRLSLTLLLIFVSGCLALFFSPKPLLLEDLDFSRVVFDSKGKLLRLTLNRNEKYRLFTPLSDISPLLINASLLQEDQYFYWHYGVNPLSMMKATWQTYLSHGHRMGASTITMQLARVRFGMNTKTFSGKILQIIKALQIETHYTKNQILEAYLNLAPYGNNIEGVGAASLIYFGKNPNKLTLPEALTLAVIPQNPNQRIPSQRRLQEIRNKLFTRWVQKHPGDIDTKPFINLPLQMQRVHNLPYFAPHFVNGALKLSSSHQITTTLDYQLQRIVEHVVKNYLQRKNNLGVHNAAVLLVDTSNMEIKALMGSGNFFNKSIKGQINGIDVKRSPGSTLKPFIYALALDQGLIHPDTILKDVPHSFGSYNPENFDYDFMGPIKAKDALVLSRNIPAIYLADLLKKPNLYEFLQAAEVKHLKSQHYYGLALVLGGAEVTPIELTQMYAMLANKGKWQPLKWFIDEKLPAPKLLLSPEASFLILDMLKDTPRLEPTYLLTHRSFPVAWKTGTSSGFRDAWSVGVFGRYVLTVWIGNFDNSSNQSFVGRSMAAPLLFEIIDTIHSQVGPLANLPQHPEELNLRHVDVCKATGLLPTRYCKDTEPSWFIPGKSPIKTDNIFREIPINKKTGLRTCHINENTKFEIYEFWSSDLLHIFKQANIERKPPPAFEKNCSYSLDKGIEPQISSPQLDLSYVVPLRNSNATKIPFSAVADADVKNLFWFVNETFVGKTQRDQTYFWVAKPGHFVVRVADDHGRTDARDLVVRVE